MERPTGYLFLFFLDYFNPTKTVNDLLKPCISLKLSGMDKQINSSRIKLKQYVVVGRWTKCK
jgi:hypothetical protein